MKVICLLCLLFISIGQSAPVIFNATESAGPGEVIGLQGASFGANPQVLFTRVTGPEGTITPNIQLTVLNKRSDYVSAEIPPNEPLGLYAVQVQDGTQKSPIVYLNRARGWAYDHHDEVFLGASLRLWGKNMALAGATPSVRFVHPTTGASTAASVNSGASDTHTIQVTVPGSLTADVQYRVFIRNGHGGNWGETEMEQRITMRTGSDPFGIGETWGRNFTFSGNVYNVKTDSRLALKAVGNGVTDDRAAVQAAIDRANSDGGGVVYFPAGTYIIAHPGGTGADVLRMRSNVVLDGDGKTSTTLKWGGGGPASDIYFIQVGDVTRGGFQDLRVDAAGRTGFHPMLGNNGGEVFFKNVRLDGGLYLQNKLRVAFLDSDLECNHVNWTYNFSGFQYAVFKRVNFNYIDGRIHFNLGNAGAHDILMENCRITRDPVRTVPNNFQEYGGVEVSSVWNLTLLNNVFDQVGTQTIPDSNDTETILNQDWGGDAQRWGAVDSATSTTITDNDGNFGSFVTPQGYVVAIVGGPGSGQWRWVSGSSSTTITVSQPWTVTPTSSSRYTVTTMGGRNWLVKGNTLSNRGCRGIWLYSTTHYNMNIVSNHVVDCDGIDILQFNFPKNGSDPGRFNASFGLYVADNWVENINNTRYAAHIGIHVNHVGGPTNFATGAFVPEFRRNTLNAFSTSTYAGFLGEGYWAVVVRDQNGWFPSDDVNTVGMLGTIFDRNTAIDTADAYQVTKGIYSTLIYTRTNQNIVNELFDLGSVNTIRGPVAPTAPSNLGASPVSASQINLSWTDNSGNETGFKIERKTGAGGTYSQIATVGANVTSYPDSGLASATTYYYRVRANNAGGDSAFSNEASATTSSSGTTIAWVTGQTLANLRNDYTGWIGLKFTVGASSITVRELGRWINSGNNQSHTIKIVNATTGADVPGASVSVSASGAPAAAYRFTVLASPVTLSANTAYYLVSSETAGGDQWRHSTTTVSTTPAASCNNPIYWSGTAWVPDGTVANTAFGPLNLRYDAGASTPSAPSGLLATPVSSSQVSLSWTDNANNETGFKIERKTGAGGTYSQIATPGANATSYPDTGLAAGTTYYYRVRANNASGDSPYSNEANATTPSIGTGGPGTIAREVWTGINGNSVASIPLGTTPNITDSLTSFEAPTDWAETYGTRIRGYLIPPTTGDYTFWIASDDESELWLSTDYNSANRSRIASVVGNTGPREWNKYPSQKSTARALNAGVRYYVEALHKEGVGGDNVAVGWAKPGQSTAAPSEVIPGSVLAPFGGVKGEYYNGTNFDTFRLARIDAGVNFDWGSGSPDPLVNADTFSTRWTGLVRPRFSQTYTFYTSSDDGVRLWVDGQPLVNKWVEQGTTEWSGTIALTANQDYDLRMEFFESLGGASAKLSWSSASESKAIIPFNRLSPATGFPTPWVGADIGSVGLAGSSSFDNGRFTIKASGSDIWDAADSFHYVYQTSTGDCEVKARVTGLQNTDPWAKAGVMIRESLSPNSKFAMMIITPANGTSLQYRNSTGGGSGIISGNDGLAAPYWVRMLRVGSTFTGYKSSDGVNWVQVGSTSITFNNAAFIGLCVTAHNNTTRNTSTLENVTAFP
jgi:hypothetical protein